MSNYSVSHNAFCSNVSPRTTNHEPRTTNHEPRTMPKSSIESWSYEQTVAAIEATVLRLEQGELPLAAVFEQFEQAVHQLHECETFLQARQAQVDLLIETLEDS